MKGQSAIVSNRHVRILDALRRQGTVEVEALSAVLKVSPVTVRRDLDLLSKKGYLLRTHGGASLIHSSSEVLQGHEFFDREISNVQEKKRIADKAAELVRDDSILFLNSGTTILFLCEALKRKHLRIMTNNAAAIFSPRNSQTEFFLLGGEYRTQSRAFVGDITLHALQGVYSDYTFLGIDGISLEQGLMSPSLPERNINQAMIHHSRGKIVVLADHSKMGKASNFITASIDRIDILVTDTNCPADFLDAITQKGVTVYQA